MGIDAEQLDKEADAEYARLMGTDKTPAPQDKSGQPPVPPADELPPPTPAEQSEPPAPDVKQDDWQDKYNKAEESRKNAHALMTQATQKAADMERVVKDLQQQVATLQAQANQQPPGMGGIPQSAGSATGTPKQPEAVQPQVPTDQFKALREDYEELDPVFNTLEQTAQQNQVLQQRLEAIEKERQQREVERKQREAEQQHQQFWAELRKHHPDADQVAASEDFKGWFARQSKDVELLSQANSLGAATVMTMYKQSIGNHTPSKIQQAQRLSEPQVRTHSQPTTTGRQPSMTLEQIAALPQKEFDANEEKYDAVLAQLLKQGG